MSVRLTVRWAVRQAVRRGPRRKAMAVAAASAFVLLAAGPAHAAEVWDVGHLPGFASDARVLADSIMSWSVEDSVEDMEQTKKEAGQTVVTLNADILFDFAKSTLPPAAPALITAAIAKAPKGAAVSIGGHTDNVGTDADNLTLSQARAQAVASALKAARPDLRLSVRGFGESTPVAGNGDAAGRSKNRRVEIRFAS